MLKYSSSVTSTTASLKSSGKMLLVQDVPEDSFSSPELAGMGAIVHAGGVAFRVWAPHAEKAFVVGSFNQWQETCALRKNDQGFWYVDVPGAKVGDEYRYLFYRGEERLSRIDPYAKEVTNSIGNGVIVDEEFDWGENNFQLPPWNEIVIYELHIGTFGDPDRQQPGNFDAAIAKFEHLKRLGVNVIQIMPTAEFAGDYSWGYNPAHIFATESAYGGPRAFKNFIRAAHDAGLGVILDVVYNHFGPSDLDLWRFDGWTENDGGGIYFYNDWRRSTPWGDTRPDYGRGEVRQFIHDNAFYWLDQFHVDGLRFDMTLYMRTANGSDLPEGWSLTQWINQDIRTKYPGRITIAEDLQNNEWLTKPVDAGGAGFSAQWDANFVHPIRRAVEVSSDEACSLMAVRDAINFKYNGDGFQRVIYSESHDEVANGKARVPTNVDQRDGNNYFAQKKSTLAAALVFTTPGIPMLFQGQEFLQGGWFQDTVPLDWDLTDTYQGILRLYRDLIRLRLNRGGTTRGLCANHVDVFHVNDAENVLAFRRWDHGGPADDVLVVMNFSSEPKRDYRIGLPQPGTWELELNSDWQGYSPDFSNFACDNLVSDAQSYDHQPASARINIGPYSALIYSLSGG
ncbi:MAG: alpha-amylase family glycosyl hydrolase [Pirellulales bacterium]|nr:alpha-amylase family glycosyl hydrolase [Pirellulales bacterium]